MPHSAVIFQGKQPTHFILSPSPSHQSVSVFYRFCVFLCLTQGSQLTVPLEPLCPHIPALAGLGQASEAVSVISYGDSVSSLASWPPSGTNISLGTPYFFQSCCFVWLLYLYGPFQPLVPRQHEERQAWPFGSPLPYSKP